MPNKLLDKAYLTKQFEIYHNTVFGVVVQNALDSLDLKVDKKDGYTLSKNDLTDELLEKLNGLHEYDDTAILADIDTNAGMIDVLNGDEDSEGSVKYYVKQRILQILDEAPETFDTIKEISDWIVNHTNQAANLQLAIDKNTEDILAFKKVWSEYRVLTPETENLDFTTDDDFCRYEWVHVVPDSIKFVGTGDLTDDPADYTISLVSSKQSVSGTVYDSEAITAYLKDVDVVGFSVNISTNLNSKTTRIEVVGSCAGSTTYEVGKVDTVIQEFHEWTHVDENTLLFDSEKTELTSDLTDYTISSSFTRETEVGKSSTTTASTVTLSELQTSGATVNVNITDNGNARTSNVSITGVDIASSTFSGESDTLEFVLRDWYTADTSTLVSSTENLTNDESKYSLNLVHHKQSADGTVYSSDPVSATLGEIESLGFEVLLELTDNGNGRKATVTISGMDIESSTYAGESSSVTKTLCDWYSVTGSTIDFVGDGDLTSETSDYTVTVHTSSKAVDGTVTKTDSTMTLSELIDLGFNVSVNINSTLKDGAITKDSVVEIAGVNIESAYDYTGISGSVSKTITYHEWYDTDYPVTLSFTGSGDLTSSKNDYKLDIAYCKENDSGTVYSNETVSKTLTEADAAGLTTTLSVESSNGSSVATVTVSGAGISDNSQNYSATTGTKTFTLKSWINVDDSVAFSKSNTDLTDSAEDYTVVLSFYKETSSSSSVGTLYNTVNAKLSELESYGLTKTFAVDTTNGCKTVNVSISGVNIGSSSSYSSTVITKNYAIHEWLKVNSDSAFDLTNYDGSSYDSCTVSDMDKIVETTSSGAVTVLASGQTYTLSQIKDAYASADVSRSVGVDNGQYQITTELTLSGMNLLSSSCINTVQNKVLTVNNYAVYTETSSSLGSGVAYGGVVKWESDE